MQSDQDKFRREEECFLALAELRGVGFESLKVIARDKIPFSSFFFKDDNERYRQSFAGKAYAARITAALPDQISRIKQLDEGRRRRDELREIDTRVLFADQPDFPEKLCATKDPAQWLFVQGSREAINQPSITAVGSRQVSNDGTWLAEYLGHSLPELKAITISGLANGVDQIVHSASLRNGLPTVAVLGTGIMLDYPKGSEDLRKGIIETGGSVVTEYLPMDSFSAKNFVRRNRIQAGLGSCVFPIEWAIKSGTSHTVKFAYEAGRPLIFARTPEQPSFDWIPGDYHQVGAFFTLPLEHTRFIQTLEDCLMGIQKQPRLI
ncbi:MAG: DNA-processing protein DprA [Pseudomonadota bacterium]|nr:DNA-processing protein DprA [Pseudomonadota bacterium]